jgi:hypothetical protein
LLARVVCVRVKKKKGGRRLGEREMKEKVEREGKLKKIFWQKFWQISTELVDARGRTFRFWAGGEGRGTWFYGGDTLVVVVFTRGV